MNSKINQDNSNVSYIIGLIRELKQELKKENTKLNDKTL